mgnify:CR=1 FL=1
MQIIIVFLRQKLAGKPLTVVGDGMQSRDFVYATDVARAFVAAAQTDKVGEIYNIGFGSPRTIDDLTKTASFVVGDLRKSIFRVLTNLIDSAGTL